MVAPTVFISYATDTKPLVEELTRALLDNGIEAWVDFKDLQPGQQWQPALDRAIEDAKFCIVLVGPKSRVSAWQEAEWRTLLTKAWGDSGKTILPVVVGSSEPPPFLRSWVALKVDPEAEPFAWTARVVNAVQSIHSPNARKLTTKSKREREERLSEIGKAVEALETRNPENLRTAIGQ